MNTKSPVVIVGCGDIGKRVAALSATNGHTVTALVRSPEKLDHLRDTVSRIVSVNLDDPSTIPPLPTSGATVFYFVPPPGGGVVDPRIRNFCAAISEDGMPARIVYLSTTGVYGDCGDLPVTEERVPDPQTTRGMRRLDAETAVSAWGKAHGVPVVILRVTGIYGPGRLPLQHLCGGAPVLAEDDALITNRIHADDLATICSAAAEKGEDGDIFNVSDGEHGSMTQYFNAVADLLGMERPRQVSREEAGRTMPPLLYSYFSESRRIDNTHMLAKLGVTLTYPTLAQGLPSCKPDPWPPVTPLPHMNKK